MIVGGFAMTATENTYKTSLINNRRYLGNKYKLLSFITGVVNDECADIETVADIFAGTGQFLLLLQIRHLLQMI